MKRKLVLVLCLLFVLVLAGCDFFTGIFDPLIGTWEYSETASGVTVTMTFTFHADNKFEGVLTMTGSADQTTAGTYTHDTKAGTLVLTYTSGGSGTDSLTYAISSDRKTLTLSQSGTVLLTLTRK